MPSASHSMLLYLCSAPVKVLLAKAIGWRIMLSGTMPFWHVVFSCSCSSAAPSPTLDISISKLSGLVSLYNFMHMSALIYDFAFSNVCWYEAFQVHVVLLDVSFCSGAHTSVIPGEHFPR